jgi:hypothetical protein
MDPMQQHEIDGGMNVDLSSLPQVAKLSRVGMPDVFRS